MSFRIFGPIVWDEMLPSVYQSYGSLEEFKCAIKDWVPDNCRCRLCKEYEPGVGFVSHAGPKTHKTTSMTSWSVKNGCFIYDFYIFSIVFLCILILLEYKQCDFLETYVL